MADEPDRLEKGIRYGCGGVFGLVLGFWLAFDEIAGMDWASALFIALSVAIVCGFLARIFGDGFWYLVLRWISRW